MITWIQRTFQQHFRIIFLVLLAGVVIAFVFTFNASSGFGRSDRHGQKRPFFGYDLTNDTDARRITYDATISVLLQMGQYPQSDNQLQQHAYRRCALLNLADKLKVPAPTEAEVKNHVRTLGVFRNEKGEFDAARYNEFLQNTSAPNANLYIPPAELGRVLRDDTRIAAVSRLIAGPGYILPSDVQQVLKQVDTNWTLETATIDRDSFKPAITPAEAQITKFFDDNRARYTIPARVRVTYAEIPAIRYAPAIQLTDAEIRAFYDANPARFPKPAAAPASMAAPSTPDSDYLAVRGQVENTLRQRRALEKAMDAASNLADQLLRAKIAPDPANTEFNLTVTKTGATLNAAIDFSARDIPPQLGPNRGAIEREAASLDADNRISNAINTGNSAIVLFWQGAIPSREPTLLEAHANVAADLAAQEKQKQFVELGQRLKTSIEAALKTGSTFEQAVAKAAQAAGVTATTKAITPFKPYMPPFSYNRPPQDVEAFMYAALDTLNQGDVSNMSIVEGNGRFVYAKTKELPNLGETNPQYATCARTLASLYSGNTVQTYAENLVQAELAKSAPKTP